MQWCPMWYEWKNCTWVCERNLAVGSTNGRFNTELPFEGLRTGGSCRGFVRVGCGVASGQRHSWPAEQKESR